MKGNLPNNNYQFNFPLLFYRERKGQNIRTIQRVTPANNTKEILGTLHMDNTKNIDHSKGCY